MTPTPYSDQFEESIRQMFSSAIRDLIIETNFEAKRGTIVFKEYGDYLDGQDKINTLLAIESARIFRNVPDLESLLMIIYNKEEIYTLKISREEIENYYGVQLGRLREDLDAWRNEFSHRYDSKPERRKFVEKFVTVTTS